MSFRNVMRSKDLKRKQSSWRNTVSADLLDCSAPEPYKERELQCMLQGECIWEGVNTRLVEAQSLAKEYCRAKSTSNPNLEQSKPELYVLLSTS